MSPRIRRLAALVAAFAPERAERLVAFAHTPDFEPLTQHTAALARRPRPERLAALAASLGAANIVAQGAPAPRHPLLQRLARETLARHSTSRPLPTSRTEVRLADAASRTKTRFAADSATLQGGTTRETRAR